MKQYKICLLGDFAVGKTSLVRRFIEGRFEEKYLTSLGVHISRRAIDISGNKIHLLIWDLGGGDTFSGVHNSYLQGAAGGLIVCDLTRRDSYEHLHGYVDGFHQINPRSPFVFLANKSDLATAREVSAEDLESTSRTGPVVVTSAKTGEGVEEGIMLLARSMDVNTERKTSGEV